MHHVTANSFAGDPFGWLIVVGGAFVTGATIILAVRLLLRPGEKEPDHPKRLILDDER